MGNHVSHAALPYPIKGARFTLEVPFLDATGTPTDPTTPDTEFSLDASSFADCAEEVTTITGSNGVGYITLTGAETNGSMVAVAAKAASGPKTTLITLYPRVLPVYYSGTAGAGAAGSITLPTAVPRIAGMLVGCIVKTTGGTGGGGTGGANNQARIITGYSSAGVATVSPNWETTPDNTTTFEILLTENSHVAQTVAPEVMQEVARIVLPFKNVIHVRSDGVDTNDGKSPLTAKLTPAGAAAIAVADDLVLIHAGDFTIASTGWNVTNGVHVVGGAPGSVTRLSSTANLNSDGVIFNPGDNCYHGNFKIIGTAATGVYQGPIGTNKNGVGSDQDFLGVYGFNITTDADSDGFFLDSSTDCDGTYVDCHFKGKYDVNTCFTNPSSQGMSFIDSIFSIAGPTQVSGTPGVSRGFTAAGGNTRLINPHIRVNNGSGATATYGIHITDNTGNPAAQVMVEGGSMIVTGPSGTITDIRIDATDTPTHAILEAGLKYRASSVTLTTGTLTNLLTGVTIRRAETSVITATSIATGAFASAKFAADYFTSITTNHGAVLLDTGITRLKAEQMELGWRLGAVVRSVDTPTAGLFTVVISLPSGATAYQVIADQYGARTAAGTMSL